MKKSAILTTVFAGSSLFGTAGAAGRVVSERPNILLIFTDDQAYETIGALGLLDIDTPNMDRLVKRGTTFTHAYNMGSYSPAVCVASRAMLITGRSLWNAELHGNRTALRAEVDTGVLWPQLMKSAGYDTYMTGKWHVFTDADGLFDRTEFVTRGMPNQTEEGYNRPLDEEDYETGWKPWETKYGGFWSGGQHWSEVTADHGITFLNEAAKKENPFFIYLSFNAPHDPRQSPREYVERYPLERVDVPESFLPQYPYRDGIGCGHVGPGNVPHPPGTPQDVVEASPYLRDEALAPFPRTEFAIKVNRQEYYAMISHLDTQIGRVLDAMEKSGQLENTWILFVSDHGLAVGHHGLVGKQNMYEHSMRVPLIIAGPNVPAGRKIDAPVYFQDLMPTTLELAGVPVPDHVEFNSLLPVLRGNNRHHYDSIYGAYLGLQRMIIRDGWKLIRYPTLDVERLYHLETDPQEIHDLAGDPLHATRILELRRKLFELGVELNDPLDRNGVMTRDAIAPAE